MDRILLTDAGTESSQSYTVDWENLTNINFNAFVLVPTTFWINTSISNIGECEASKAQDYNWLNMFYSFYMTAACSHYW